MSLGHTIGMALGALAAIVAAFLAAAPALLPEPYNQLALGLVAAFSTGSVYLQRAYPAGVADGGGSAGSPPPGP